MFPTFISRSKSILLGAALLLAASGSAQAANKANEVVTVDGPYTITQHGSFRFTRLDSDRQVAISRKLDYSDLDLGTDSGQFLLKDRIRTTARDLCRQIDLRFPKGFSGDNSHCVRDAVGRAMTATRADIAAAQTAGHVDALR